MTDLFEDALLKLKQRHNELDQQLREWKIKRSEAMHNALLCEAEMRGLDMAIDALEKAEAPAERATTAQPKQRAQRGAVERDALETLLSIPLGEGGTLEDLENATGHNRSSLHSALKKLITAGKVVLDGTIYRMAPSLFGGMINAAQ